MPGHIYSQTGRWDDAVKSFSTAAVNERKWMGLDKQYGDGHHGHNVNYLSTSYSFEGRYDDAVEAAKELLGYAENPGQKAQVDLMTSAYAQGWFSMLRAQLQFEKWDAILDSNVLPELNRPRQQAWRHWARAMAFAHKNDVSSADAEAQAFETAMAAYKEKTKRPEPAELQVARQEMLGHLLLAKGNIDKGLKQLELASRADRRLTYTEPPYYPRPVAEALGHAAFANGRKAMAEKAYRAALEQYPADAHAKPQNASLAEK
jgi:tetratricopeptide (TPR) repeat protein